jgi:hypothetical protein
MMVVGGGVGGKERDGMRWIGKGMGMGMGMGKKGGWGRGKISSNI